MNERPAVTVRATPDAGTWARLALARFASLTEEQRAERAQFGLPTDRPVIMTGHQSGFWHPGILAKYIAADRIAKAVNGVAGAVVVDHDVVDPLKIEAAGESETGQLSLTTISLRARSGGTTLSRLEPPIGRHELDRWAGADRLLGTDRVSIDRVISSLLRYTESESLGEQAARANAELLEPWMRVQQFSAQQLIRSPSWRAFFVRATEDPAACVRAYNRAVTRHPEAGIPPLFAMEREYRWELPFWMLDRTAGRRPLYAEMVEQPGFDPDLLATKALSLTASVRRGLCDLFIHGTGGAIYDRATDDWIRDWLGETLAPSVAITADVYRTLPVDARREVSEDELRQARWMANSARHNPGLLGDERAEREKLRYLKLIRDAPRASADRLDHFRDMHHMLGRSRESHWEELASLDREVLAIGQGLTARDLEAKRDWASVLYSAHDLDRLTAVIEDAVLSNAERPISP